MLTPNASLMETGLAKLWPWGYPDALRLSRVLRRSKEAFADICRCGGGLPFATRNSVAFCRDARGIHRSQGQREPIAAAHNGDIDGWRAPCLGRQFSRIHPDECQRTDPTEDEPVELKIETLWRTVSQQCELVSLGLRGSRLRLWVKGNLVVDEEVSNWPDALKRASELRIESAHMRD